MAKKTVPQSKTENKSVHNTKQIRLYKHKPEPAKKQATAEDYEKLIVDLFQLNKTAAVIANSSEDKYIQGLALALANVALAVRIASDEVAFSLLLASVSQQQANALVREHISAAGVMNNG